ncbi:B12-binding domain-containing radical SAM protein [Streptantibioticus silvisoli]|uniref:Radical SAM protein n=1 Tax=Streptantibioticus silvisoli TaxID=2705255 RepID=A0ABT6VRN6_9ACTN|nr:radical SAM protein [Streptantibioticus silvisoli]MDI5961136.1 radical SAM protein [Streptantibioticus silvisoli]
MTADDVFEPVSGGSPALCHLIEVTAMPEVRYSLILGSLQASAQADPQVASAYRFAKHVLFQDPGLMGRLPQWVAGLEEPAVVALSTYFWNRAAVMSIAREVKRHWPRCVVVLGGNDVSYQTKTVFAEPAVDVLVHGEGEITFREVLRALAVHGSPAGVAGISHREGEKVVTTVPAPRIMDLSELPSPLLSGVYDKADLAASRTIIMETNRGCPYSCAFCYWGGATKSKVRPFPLEQVKAEISYVVENAPQNATLFIADANFGILPRDVEIAEWLVAELRRHDKQMFLYTNWAKNTSKRVIEAARILYSHKLIAAVTLSAQSFTPEVLEIAHRSNIRTSTYRTMQREFQSYGIPTYTELIWGLPGETLETHLDSVEEAITAGGHPVVYPLLLLNNTEYTTETFRDEHELVTRVLPYQVSNPEMQAEFVVGHARMTQEDWQRGLDIRLAGAVFYNCLNRCVLHYLNLRTGVRVVDLYARLVDYLENLCSDETVRRLAANQRVTWEDPAALDHSLVGELLDSGAIPEHLHYQAIVHRLTALDSIATITREAAEYLYAGLDSHDAVPRQEFEAVLAFQAVAAESLADCVRGDNRTRETSLPEDVHTLLAEAGQVTEAAAIDGEVHITLDSGNLAGTPADTMLLAIYHGSVRVPRALQPAVVPV